VRQADVGLVEVAFGELSAGVVDQRAELGVLGGKATSPCASRSRRSRGEPGPTGR